MNFIKEGNISKNLCDDIIYFFNNSEFAKKNKHLGITESGYYPQDKKSIDLSFFQSEVNEKCINEYFNELQKVCEEYIKNYFWCNQYSSWGIIEPVNIQYYKPSWGYTKYHTERVSSKHPVSSRHLVFMTYLNTVTVGGETEFYYQDIKIKADKGKTIIWPADWTHTHRGIPSSKEEKYIITGWYNYMT